MSEQNHIINIYVNKNQRQQSSCMCVCIYVCVYIRCCNVISFVKIRICFNAEVIVISDVHVKYINATVLRCISCLWN